MTQESTGQAGQDENSSKHTKRWIKPGIEMGRVLGLCRRGRLRASRNSSSSGSGHIECSGEDGCDRDVSVATTGDGGGRN